MVAIKFKQVLDFSFDIPSMPILDMDFTDQTSAQKLACGWYSQDNRSASVITTMVSDTNCKSFLNDPSMQARYVSGNILFALEKKVQFFSLNNRDWLITIHVTDIKKAVDLSFCSANNAFITQSSRNSNIYGCWLMSQLAAKKLQALSEIDWLELYELFSTINRDNACTIILKDGSDTVFYQGSDFANSLYYVRSFPPHDNNGLFKSGRFIFQMDALDLNHTLTVVSTAQIQHRNSKFFNLNQMMVVRSGEIIWNKDPNAYSDQTAPKIPIPELSKIQEYLHKVELVNLPAKGLSKNRTITIPAETQDKNPSMYSIIHQTVYEYDAPVYLSKHLFRLQPTMDLTQSLLDFELIVLADGTSVKCIPSNFMGAFGNYASFIEIDQVYRRLEVICRSQVCITTPASRRFDLLKNHSIVPLIWMPWDRIMMQAYLVPPELPESELRELSGYALSFVKRNGNDVFLILNDINRTIYQDYEYVSGSTTLETTAYEVYTSHRGVCQDFANLFICLARLLNIPARYRTGYVFTANDYENQVQGDASHAWLEVFLPNIGWLGFDPTNYCLAEKNHVRVACGRTLYDTAPTSGTIFRGGGIEQLSVDVRVIQLDKIDYNRG